MKDEQVLVDIVFQSASGPSLRTATPPLKREDLARYAATEETRKEALEQLQRLGFTVVGPATPFGVSISGPRSLVKSIFGRSRGELDVPESLTPWIAAARIPPPGEFY